MSKPSNLEALPRVANYREVGLIGVWTLVILVLCWMPARQLPVSEGPEAMILPHLDKAVHFGLFAVLGGLLANLRPAGRRSAWLLAGGLGLAILSEAGQAMPFVGREPGLWDVTADAAGLFSGFWAIASLRARRGPFPWKRPSPG